MWGAVRNGGVQLLFTRGSVPRMWIRALHLEGKDGGKERTNQPTYRREGLQCRKHGGSTCLRPRRPGHASTLFGHTSSSDHALHDHTPMLFSLARRLPGQILATFTSIGLSQVSKP